MNWYKKYKTASALSAANMPPSFRKSIAYLIQAVWNSGMLDKEAKYDDYQVELVIDSDERLNDIKGVLASEIAKSNGVSEDSASIFISDELKNELIRREEALFKRREDKLKETQDPFGHIYEAIKGKSWKTAKRTIFEMLPRGEFATPNVHVSDEDAEDAFQRLCRTVYKSDFLDINLLTEASPYKNKNGERYIKRFNEITFLPKDQLDKITDDSDRIDQYCENQIMLKMGWVKNFEEKAYPPETVEIYRGTSRADASLRAGEYVTPDRAYARGYVRGKYGKIIREVVSTKDLIMMKKDDYNRLEMIYLPESAIPTNAQQDTPKQLTTLKDVYNKVNGEK
jgi:hypothetical protein